MTCNMLCSSVLVSISLFLGSRLGWRAVLVATWKSCSPRTMWPLTSATYLIITLRRTVYRLTHMWVSVCIGISWEQKEVWCFSDWFSLSLSLSLWQAAKTASAREGSYTTDEQLKSMVSLLLSLCSLQIAHKYPFNACSIQLQKCGIVI